MKRKAISALALVLLAGSATAADVRVSLGLLPTSNYSGEPGAAGVTKALPHLLFDRLDDPRVRPVMLNPGGGFSSLDEDWAAEHGRLAGVDAVLVTSLTERIRKSGRIVIKGFVLDVKTGRKSPEMIAEATIRKEDMDGAITFDSLVFFGRSKLFEKAPVGKATSRVAGSVAAQVPAATQRLIPEGTWRPSPPAADRCNVRFRVRYAEVSRSSKNYALVVNGLEESLGVADGVAHVVLPAGPTVLHVAVRDAPFRLPVQAVYSMNTDLCCPSAEQGLVLEIGALGDGLLKTE